MNASCQLRANSYQCKALQTAKGMNCRVVHLGLSLSLLPECWFGRQNCIQTCFVMRVTNKG